MASGAIRTARLSWQAMLLLPLVVSAFFAPLQVTQRLGNAPYAPSSTRILSISNEAEDDKVDTNIDATIESKKYTMARAGGRRPRVDQTSRSNQLDVVKERIFSLIGDFGLPFLIMMVALRLIFGGGGSTDNPNVVFYSRSVYQSTSYTNDGKVETTRKENFQSNVPELVKQAKVKENKQQLRGSAEEKDFFNIIDENLEDEIDLIFGKW
jgi:hypothetical protein